MRSAIDILEGAFRGTLPSAPQRTRIQVGAGHLLLMAAEDGGVGVKLVTVNPPNSKHGAPIVQAVYVLFSQDTLSPVATFDGAALTALRTASVSGLATRYLAREDAGDLVIFGAGVQATAHLEAMREVRTIRRLTVVSRTQERAESLAAMARAEGIEASLGTADAIEGADIVCTCTTSAEPVFDGSLLRPGVHVNAIGAYTPDTRELDDETVRRGKIVVETRAAALEEAGDLLIPLRAGVIDGAAILAELPEIVRAEGFRRDPEDITVFKSVGVAFEDLVVARAAWEAA
ncbi:MAG: ornithine cyclodeaminase family protein [Actinomycetota bacterium]